MRVYTVRLYLKIVSLINRGRTPKEIAHKLGISRSLVYIARFRLSRAKKNKRQGP